MCLLCKHSLMANLPASSSNQMASPKPNPTENSQDGVGPASDPNQDIWDGWGRAFSTSLPGESYVTLRSEKHTAWSCLFLKNPYPLFLVLIQGSSDTHHPCSGSWKFQSFVTPQSWIKVDFLIFFIRSSKWRRNSLQPWIEL